MTEKTIYLEDIDPVQLYGINDHKLKIIKKLFPKLNITGRGDTLKFCGESNEINEFETFINNIINYLKNYNSISSDKINELLNPEINISHEENIDNLILYGNHGKVIKARTKNQKLLVDKYKDNDLIFATGPAGSGKTYTAIALAVRALKNKEIKKIILSRPAVEAGEQLGFLPGDLKDKLDPYLQPLYDALTDMIPPKKLEFLIAENIIQIAPLAYMRGRTLENAFAILDEAQNATKTQLKMFLTRMGKYSKFIVTGDLSQIDLINKKDSGLNHSINLLKNIDKLSVINFTRNDIVRHKLVQDIVDAYEKDEK